MAKNCLSKNKSKSLNPVFYLQTKEDEDKNLTKGMIKVIRKTGNLNLSGRNLQSIPNGVFKMYELSDEERSHYLDFDKKSEYEENWWNFHPLIYIDFSSNMINNLPENMEVFETVQTANFQDNCLENLPSAFGSLKQLRKLNISKNKLKSLPPEFFTLNDLEILNLANNELNEINRDVSDMVMLKELDLSNNYLTQLPIGLGYLVRLTDINLSNNKLVNLPADIVNMRGLKKLDVTNNELTCLPNIGELRRLEFLFARHNNIKEFPNFEGSEQLQEIYLGNNYLEEIPLSFCENMHRLKILELRDNKVKKIPAEIGMLVNIIRLDFTNNDIETLPHSIGFLPHLQNIQLDGNKLVKIRSDIIKGGTMRIMKYLRESSPEEEIQAWVVPEKPMDPLAKFPDKYSMRNTQTLNISINNLQNIPDEVFHNAKWAGVYCVNLCRNHLTRFPSGIKELTEHLSELNLSINLLTEIPEEIGSFHKLKYLNLGNNKLSNLPESLSSLEYLKELVINNNSLTEVPDCVYKLKALEILIASQNKIVSINVDGFRKLTHIAVLDLSNNSIEKVPPEFGLLKQLRSVELRGNLFRQPRLAILDAGTEAVLSYLRDRIPVLQVT